MKRLIGQWVEIGGPEIYPHKYGQLIFDKDAKIIKCRQNSLFNHSVATMGHPYAKIFKTQNGS